MTTTPDAALALADDADEMAKSCVHAAQFPAEFPSRLYLAAGCLTGTAAALRDLADAGAERDRLVERVRELEAAILSADEARLHLIIAGATGDTILQQRKFSLLNERLKGLVDMVDTRAALGEGGTS